MCEAWRRGGTGEVDEDVGGTVRVRDKCVEGELGESESEEGLEN